MSRRRTAFKLALAVALSAATFGLAALAVETLSGWQLSGLQQSLLISAPGVVLAGVALWRWRREPPKR